MVWSFSRLSGHGHRRQHSLLTPSSDVVELEKRHLMEDDSSDDADALPLAHHYAAKVINHRQPRLLKITIAFVLSALAVIALHAALVGPQLPTPYSALPEWPLAFASDEAFSEEALEAWVARGELPASPRSRPDFSQHTRLDTVTFWVNGSDPRHAAARARFAANVSLVDIPSNKIRRQLHKRDINGDLQNFDQRFREQNELLYNLRSHKQSINTLGTSHVITTDFWDDGHDVEGIQDRLFEGRRGQMPSWLDMKSELVAYGSEMRSHPPALRLHHDWETFAPLVKTTEDVNEWKERRLPTFNSMAAEAVLGANLPELSDYSILASDDMFLAQPMSTADFVSPLYGPVLHLKMEQMIHSNRRTTGEGPEYAGLDYSVNLLFKRFGTRLFPYLLHVHKVLSKPLLIESRMMWRAALEEASLKRFRGNGYSANSHMLSYGLIVERHREALLWSFLVNKLDVNGDGRLDDAERDRAYRLMGTDGKSDIVGRMRSRNTAQPERISQSFDAVSFPRPVTAKYSFSSFDGYLLNQPSAQYTEETGYKLGKTPFSFTVKEDESAKDQQRFVSDFCRVSMDTCWPQTNNVSEIFTRFAFQEPACGDCLIAHLVEQSGSAGLEAFLPEANAGKLTTKGWIESQVPKSVPAHLPLGDDWKTLLFSLSSIASINKAGWNRRAFSIHLIQRYNYVMGSARVSFNMVVDPGSATHIANHLLEVKPAFICINDDIFRDLDETRSVLQRFFESMWPSSATRLAFEKMP